MNSFCWIAYHTTCSCKKLLFTMEINWRAGRQKLANFKVIFDLFISCFYFIQQQKYKLYYVTLMIISEIQSKRAHWSCFSSKVKAPADFSHYAILATSISLNTEISKEAWKQTVDKHVSAYWVDKIKLEASEKSSFKFLNTQNYKIGEVHYLWKNAGFNLMAIKKAGLKAKLMTGTYVLQSNRAKFNHRANSTHQQT